jgi:hypothetical protein
MINESGLLPPFKSVLACTPRNFPLSRGGGDWLVDWRATTRVMPLGMIDFVLAWISEPEIVPACLSTIGHGNAQF